MPACIQASIPPGCTGRAFRSADHSNHYQKTAGKVASSEEAFKALPAKDAPIGEETGTGPEQIDEMMASYETT